MSSLLLLNGSPRGASSNSMTMLSRVAEGWLAEKGEGATVETLHLAKRADFERAVEAFGEVDEVLIGMPLYADAMPALGADYFAALARYVGCEGNPRMAFLTQCGFIETLHCRGLERYFEKLARRLGAEYAGTIVRGNSEALRSMPEEASKKLWARLVALGASLARDGRFDGELLSVVAGMECLSAPIAMLLKPALVWPLPALMWGGEMKAKGGWEMRNARPYSPSRELILKRRESSSGRQSHRPPTPPEQPVARSS